MNEEIGVFSSLFELFISLNLAFSIRAVQKGLRAFCKERVESVNHELPDLVLKVEPDAQLSEMKMQKLDKLRKERDQLSERGAKVSRSLFNGPLGSHVFVVTGLFGLVSLLLYALHDCGILHAGPLSITLFVQCGLVLFYQFWLLVFESDEEVQMRPQREHSLLTGILIAGTLWLLTTALVLIPPGTIETYWNEALLAVTFTMMSPFILLLLLLLRFAFNLALDLSSIKKEYNKGFAAPTPTWTGTSAGTS